MQMSSLTPSQNPGRNVGIQQIFTILVAVVILGAGLTFVIRWHNENVAAQNLCRSMVAQILADAKQNPPEVGIYEATLSETDSWGQPLTSTLIVEELSNSATVSSTGRDRIVSSDDYSSHRTDVHVRKSILKGITAGAHSAGKGLTSGVIEGLGEAKDASLEKAKAGAKKVKTSLMDRFKKRETKDEDD